MILNFIEKRKLKLILGTSLIIFLILGIIYEDEISRAVVILDNLDSSTLKEYILGFGIWAPIASFILMILQSIVAPIPSVVIVFVNAALFGWFKGAILSFISALSGACLCFYIARLLGRDVVEKLVSKTSINKVDKFFKEYGSYTVLIARLLPFVSFDLISYAAGLTGMSFLKFFIATALGQLPTKLIYSYAGEAFIGNIENIIAIILIISSLVVLAMLIKKYTSSKRK